MGLLDFIFGKKMTQKLLCHNQDQQRSHNRRPQDLRHLQLQLQKLQS